MTSWVNYFNGTTLKDTHNSVELEQKWWETLLKKTYKTRNPRLEAPISVHEGTLNQNTIDSRHSGHQSMAMSLAALNWWRNKSGSGHFSSRGCDHSTLYGHFNHLVLSKKYDVGRDPIITDLPDQLDLQYGRYIRQANWEQIVRLTPSQTDRNTEFLTEFLLGFTGSPFGCIVTLGNHNHAVMYTVDNRWLVFDSNGDIEFQGHYTENSSCWEFPSVDGVVAFLNAIHPDIIYCVVARPVIVAKPPKKTARFNRSQYNVTAHYSTSSCPGRIESGPFRYEDDPYVSMMGGFGGY